MERLLRIHFRAKRGTPRRHNHHKAQGLAEFAIILPLLLLLVFGSIEFGRLLFTFSAVVSSSSEGARYGASIGTNSVGVPHYNDCAGIRAAAKRIGSLASVDDGEITIQYDRAGSVYTGCPPPDPPGISLGDRIIVRVSILYQPLLPLVNMPPIPLNSESKRTILKEVVIE